VHSLGLFPSEQNLGCRASVHRQDGAYRHRVSKTAQTLGCGHADALLALTTVELAGLAGGISQRGQYWASGRK
jgi:hypothetical protein